MATPIYQQIKSYILNNIESGTWPIGHRIPTELELTEQFSVSRMTVNKAIRDLVSEQRLQRKPRLGTFVCAPSHKAESPLVDIRNIAEEVKARGHRYHNTIQAQHQIIADENVATRLGVMLGSPVFYSEIIHFENDHAIQLECRWVNIEFAPDYLKQDFSQITPTQYLFEHCPLSAIEHSVEAIIPSASVQKSLQMTSNDACLQLKRRTWSKRNLVSFALLYHPGSRYKLSSKVTF